MSEDVLVLYADEIAFATEHNYAESYCIIGLAVAVRALRAQVAELEPDAKLGRMVRKMPLQSHLSRYENPNVWHFGQYVLGRAGIGSTPEAALEAAPKEET